MTTGNNLKLAPRSEGRLGILQGLWQVCPYSIFVLLFGYASFFKTDLMIPIIVAILLYVFITKQSIHWSNSHLVLTILAFSVYILINSLSLTRLYFNSWHVVLPSMLFIMIVCVIPAEKFNYLIIGYGIILIALFVATRGILRYSYQGIRFWYNMNTNFLGGFLATILPVAIGLMLRVKKWPFRLLGLLMTLPIMAAIIITSCRGSLLAVFIAILFISIIHRNYWILPFYALYSYVVSYLTTNFLEKRVIGLLFTQLSDASTVIRIQLWKAGWRIFTKNPLFGCGLSNYTIFSFKQGIPSKYLMSGQFPETIHNSYLQILAELGLVGAIIFTFMLILLVYPIIKHCIKTKRNADIILISFAAGSLAFLIQNMTNSLIFLRSESAFAWIFMGLSICRLRYLKNMSEGGSDGF